MIHIVADAGATKCSWLIINSESGYIEVDTDGISLTFANQEQIRATLCQLREIVNLSKVERMYFYGAGVMNITPETMPYQIFREMMPMAELIFESDLLAAARALFGSRPGIACIIGTGSNSCEYDGSRIVSNVKAGGYILGDEASGAYLGKMLLSDYIKGLLPNDLNKKFEEKYGLDYPAIVQKVYKEAQPSRFLASFSPFLADNRDIPYVRDLLKNSFATFIERNLIRYDYKHLETGFVGSTAYYYRDLLEEALSERNIILGRVLRNPAKGLVEYHTALLIREN